MKVLFIAREKTKDLPGYVVQNQANSLRSEGIEIDFFLVRKGGFIGYLISFFQLKKSLIKQYDVIHAHYGLSGILASLKSRKLIVSLMGSDVLNTSKLNLKLLKYLAKTYWKATILKSPQMAEKMGISKSFHIIGNGVNLNIFQPRDISLAKEKLNLRSNYSYILFVGDPLRKEKNFELAMLVEKILEYEKIKLLVVNNISPESMPYYYNASHCLLVTSFYEGSMNSIKEAMACNVPILSTDVGDAKANLQDLDFCEIIPYDASVIARKVKLLCQKLKRNSGRERILSLNFDHTSINKKLKVIYKDISERGNNN